MDESMLHKTIEKDPDEGDDGSWMEDEDAPENTDIIIMFTQQI